MKKSKVVISNRYEVLKQIGIEPTTKEGAEALACISQWEYNLKPTLSIIGEYRLVHSPDSDGYLGTYYAAASLGHQISLEINNLIEQGKIWEATLLDTLADHWLMDETHALYEKIASECRDRGWGLSTRKVPGTGYPLSMAQKIISSFESDILGIRYNEPGFLEPVKSVAYFYEVTHSGLVPEHDEECSACTNIHCPRRFIPVDIQVIDGEELKCFSVSKGVVLQSALQEVGMAPDAPCNGRGICGLCTVKLQDETGNIFNVKACTYKVEKPVKIWVPENKLWQIETETINTMLTIEPIAKYIPAKQFFLGIKEIKGCNYEALHGIFSLGNSIESGWFLIRNAILTAYLPVKEAIIGAAIDIGTTTIVIRIINLETGQVIRTEAFSNPLRIYGGDILSRVGNIEAFHDMGQLLRKKIGSSLDRIEEMGVSLSETVVVCNNAMAQIFLELPSEGLARAPYWHWMHHPIETSAGNLWSNRSGYVTVLQGVGAFTGSDLVAGMIYVGLHQTSSKTLFIDLGTNGEMAIGNKDGILATSVAAGPAFEMLEGTTSISAVSGAVTKVNCLGAGRWHVETVHDEKPIGFCGSGIISLIAEMIRYGLIGRDGTICDEESQVYINNDLFISQQGIRSFQLAKSAFRSGIELLLQQKGWKASELEQIIIAGGFSKNISPKDLITIGLLPEVKPNIVFSVGNAALGGAAAYMLNKEARSAFKSSKHFVETINLADVKEFQERFIKYLNF